MSTGKPAPPLPLQKPPGYRDPAIPIHHAPPRKAVKLPPSFQQTRRRSCCRVFCCCVFFSIFILAIVFALTGFLFFFWYQPRLPEIHLKSINFTKFDITTARDGTVLDARSTVGVLIRNPNQNFGIVYDRSQVSLNAVNGDVNLGEQTVAGFSQESSNTTTLRFATAVRGEICHNSGSSRMMNAVYVCRRIAERMFRREKENQIFISYRN